MATTNINETTPFTDWFEFTAGAPGESQPLTQFGTYSTIRVDALVAYWSDPDNPLRFRVDIIKPDGSLLGSGFFIFTVPAGCGSVTPCPDLFPPILRSLFNGIALSPGYGLQLTTLDTIGSGQTCTVWAVGGTL